MLLDIELPLDAAAELVVAQSSDRAPTSALIGPGPVQVVASNIFPSMSYCCFSDATLAEIEIKT
jgi:hypothetical protein